jgi:hypothetical protein
MALAAGLLLVPGKASAAPVYTVAYTDGGTWNTVYVQGFSTSLIDEGIAPSPTPNVGDPVTLSEFDFYKSGTGDSASNIQLAILNNIYTDLTGLTTANSAVVGLSSNTIASTASIATGAPEQFFFPNLPLTYGDDYAAMFVNVGAGGSLTPVLVSALTANYVLESDGNYHPATNYGTETQYQYTTSNYINSGYFAAFSYSGDADFTATLSTVPEPASMGLLAGSAGLLMLRRRSAR